MINFDGVDFGKCRSEEVMFLLMLRVQMLVNEYTANERNMHLTLHVHVQSLLNSLFSITEFYYWYPHPQWKLWTNQWISYQQVHNLNGILKTIPDHLLHVHVHLYVYNESRQHSAPYDGKNKCRVFVFSVGNESR